MGRRSKSAPRHGSLAFLPRGRAKHPIGRVNHWPTIQGDSPKLLGFCGYKVGMTSLYIIGDTVGSPTYGQDTYTPVTLVEVPPMILCGLRAYSKTISGLKSLTELWTRTIPVDLTRLSTSLGNINHQTSSQKMKSSIGKISELRAILCNQPRQSGVSNKKPVLFEVKVDGGSISEQFTQLEELLGKEVEISNVFSEGQFVDVIAVTKGKGTQGPVKRWGVKKLPHKSRKTVRGVGTLGAWTPHYVMYSVPRAGQMGFHQRTELNKRILKIGSDGNTLSPKGGFPNYGLIHKDYLILKGSAPGPPKRLLKLRNAFRPSTTKYEPPKIIE